MKPEVGHYHPAAMLAQRAQNPEECVKSEREMQNKRLFEKVLFRFKPQGHTVNKQ